MKIYTNEELELMSNEAKMLYISELQLEITRLSQKKQSKAGVFNGGSPQIVRDFVNASKKLLEEKNNAI